MPKYYTGVGARVVDVSGVDRILEIMETIASKMRASRWILRSGGAEGSDTAFAKGARGKAEIYLPYKNFNKDESPLYLKALDYEKVETARSLAEAIHPKWDACSSTAKSMHTRNVFQVLGRDLETPSDFLVCWTEAVSGGGTRTAIKLAEQRNIPVFNLAKPFDLPNLVNWLKNQHGIFTDCHINDYVHQA